MEVSGPTKRVVSRFDQLLREVRELPSDSTRGTRPLTQAQIDSLKVRTQVEIDDARRQKLGDSDTGADA